MNSATELPSHLIDHKDIFCCPICQGDFNINDESIKCDECNHEYKVKDGIPHLYIPNDWDSSKNDVTLSMKSFYENSPFPNYDDIDDLGTLINKSQKGVFARMLNEQIPFNIKVLEVGTGTGQLTNFLGIAQRYIFGVDMTLNSLSLAQKFKNKHNLNRVGFYQMNLFKPIFKENSFPLVICNGVLHHTSDPFRGFESISRLVEINGYIIIGLYHRYGRIITDIRRLMFRVSGNRFKWLDPNLRKLDVNKTKSYLGLMTNIKTLTNLSILLERY